MATIAGQRTAIQAASIDNTPSNESGFKRLRAELRERATLSRLLRYKQNQDFVRDGGQAYPTQGEAEA